MAIIYKSGFTKKDDMALNPVSFTSIRGNILPYWSLQISGRWREYFRQGFN